MNDEQLIAQKDLDDLLANANNELTELKPENTDIQNPSVTEEIATTEPQIPEQIVQTPIEEQPPVSFFKKLKQHLTKKTLLIAFFLLTLAITIGALLGYKIANQATSSLPPIEKITAQGITFEEKNFVTYAGLGDKNIVNAFLDAGMPVDVIRATDGWTPLISACFYKKAEVVQLLLEKEALVDIQDKYGKTALMEATAMGAENIVVMLLEYGANPNLQDINGRTALSEAYLRRYAKIAEILKNAGADPTIKPSAPSKSSAKSSTPSVKEPVSVPLVPSIPEENLVGNGKAGFIQIGMTIADIQKKYSNLKITEKYIDGVKKSIANIYLNDPNNPAIQLELSSGTLKLVSTISAYDEKFSTDKQISTHSSVGDARKQYTFNDVKFMNNAIFLTVKSMKMLFELDIPPEVVLTEWINTDNPSSIPDDIKIKRIVVY